MKKELIRTSSFIYIFLLYTGNLYGVEKQIYRYLEGTHCDIVSKEIHLMPQKTFAEQVTEKNKTYVIHDDFTVHGNVAIPDSCVLDFKGGSLNGGAIIFNNTFIKGDYKLNNIVSISGTIINDVLYASNFSFASNNEKGLTSDENELVSLISLPIRKLILKRNYIYNINATAPTNLISDISMIDKEIDFNGCTIDDFRTRGAFIRADYVKNLKTYNLNYVQEENFLPKPGSSNNYIIVFDFQCTTIDFTLYNTSFIKVGVPVLIRPRMYNTIGENIELDYSVSNGDCDIEGVGSKYLAVVWGCKNVKIKLTAKNNKFERGFFCCGNTDVNAALYFDSVTIAKAGLMIQEFYRYGDEERTNENAIYIDNKNIRARFYVYNSLKGILCQCSRYPGSDGVDEVPMAFRQTPTVYTGVNIDINFYNLRTWEQSTYAFYTGLLEHAVPTRTDRFYVQSNLNIHFNDDIIDTNNSIVYLNNRYQEAGYTDIPTGLDIDLNLNITSDTDYKTGGNAVAYKKPIEIRNLSSKSNINIVSNKNIHLYPYIYKEKEGDNFNIKVDSCGYVDFANTNSYYPNLYIENVDSINLPNRNRANYITRNRLIKSVSDYNR